VEFVVLRDGRRVTLTAHLVDRNSQGEKVGFLGVSPKFTHKRLPPGTAVVESGKLIGVGSWESLKALGTIVSPKTIGRLFSVISGRSERSVTDPTSVLGIGRAAGEVASKQGIAELLISIVVGFNIFVGVVNLLPLPPLDGGHLAVLGYESIRQRSRRWRREGRRTVDMQKLLPVSVLVVSILVTLFVLSLYLDIVKPLPVLPG
jgi:membrane-associated protease RseP (regulator of RpoE activity)